MITINLKKKTNTKGNLLINVPTPLIEKEVEIVLVIQEKNEPFEDEKIMKKRKFDFSDLYGKLEWKGDALAEQKKIRSEWQ
jgi:hypothetical protein